MSETPKLSVEDEVTAIAKRNLQRIDLDKAHKSGVKITAKKTSKLLRLMHEHGEGSIEKIEVLPNFEDGVAPHRLPSGFVAIFDARKSRVYAESFPMEAMFAGTMAVRVPASELAASPLSPHGMTKNPAELVQTLGSVQGLANSKGALCDGYTGLFEDVSTNADEDYEHNYWLVTRSVDPTLNESLAQSVFDADRDQAVSLGSFLEETKSVRNETYSAQRKFRAEQVSRALASLHIDLSAERILGNPRAPVLDNVCNTVEMDSDGKKAALYCNAVPLTDNNLRTGVIVNSSLRTGPTLLQGKALGRGNSVDVESIAAFPATAPTSVSPWRIKLSPEAVPDSALDVDEMCQLSSRNSKFTWASGSSVNAILAKNLYTKSSHAGWRAYQTNAGFSFDGENATKLRTVAVCLDH